MEIVLDSQYSESLLRDKRSAGVIKEASLLPSLVSTAYNNVGSLGLVQCGSPREENIGYDINYFSEVNGFKFFRPTEFGIHYPEPRFRITLADSEESSENVLVMTRLAIINARREIVSLMKESLALQSAVELAASNYSSAKNNLEFGTAKMKVIMDQVRAVLECPVTFPYNNNQVGVLNDFVKLDENTGLFKDSGFFPEYRFRSNWFKQTSCGRSYFGLRGCFAPKRSDDTSSFYQGEEYGLAPNFISNMGIPSSYKTFVTSKRQTYKPLFGKEKEVVKETRVTRPCFAGRSLIVSVVSYLNNLTQSIRNTLKLNYASELIISESLSKYSAIQSERSSILARIDTLQELVGEYGSIVCVDNYPELSIDNSSAETPLVIIPELIDALRSMQEDFKSRVVPIGNPGIIEEDAIYVTLNDDGSYVEIPHEDIGDIGAADSYWPFLYKLEPVRVGKQFEVETTMGVFTLQVASTDPVSFIISEFSQTTSIDVPKNFEPQSVFALSKAQASVLRFYYGVNTEGVFEFPDFNHLVASSKSVYLEYGVASAAAALALLRKECL